MFLQDTGTKKPLIDKKTSDQIVDMMDHAADALGLVVQGLGGPAPRTPTKHIPLDANDWLIDLFGSDWAGMGKVCITLLDSVQQVKWQDELPKFCESMPSIHVCRRRRQQQ